MSKEIREQIDKFKDFILKESVNKSSDFEKIDKVIRAYIKYVLKTDKKLTSMFQTHI